MCCPVECLNVGWLHGLPMDRPLQAGAYAACLVASVEGVLVVAHGTVRPAVMQRLEQHQ
jgi:hypothetical protein